jgi:hypothetical protein
MKTISIQKRIYPDIVEAVEAEAVKQDMTPTKLAARTLRKALRIKKKNAD